MPHGDLRHACPWPSRFPAATVAAPSDPVQGSDESDVGAPVPVGKLDGRDVGRLVGMDVGRLVGTGVGKVVGTDVGMLVGRLVGSDVGVGGRVARLPGDGFGVDLVAGVLAAVCAPGVLSVALVPGDVRIPGIVGATDPPVPAGTKLVSSSSQ
jgi:hypothetical protein